MRSWWAHVHANLRRFAAVIDYGEELDSLRREEFFQVFQPSDLPCGCFGG